MSYCNKSALYEIISMSYCNKSALYEIISMRYCNKSALYEIISMRYCNKSALYARERAHRNEKCTGACTYLHLICNYLQVNMLQITIRLHLAMSGACTWQVQVQAGASRCKHLTTFRSYAYARVKQRR